MTNGTNFKFFTCLQIELLTNKLGDTRTINILNVQI